jgi:sulfhydrogenase subunit beta (sulfur reductase)
MYNESNTSLNTMKRYYFDQLTTNKFVEFLMSQAELIAPHKKGDTSYSYEVVTSDADIVYNYPRTIQPLKKYFLPPRETLLSFDSEKNEFNKADIESTNRIFFAIHSYEMQGIKRLDYSFTKGNPEYNYLKRRENSIFIGISFNPDKWHFTKSVGIAIEDLEGFSLYFEPVENGFLVFEVDDIGKELIRKFGNGFSLDVPIEFEVRKKEFQAKIKFHYNRLPRVFEHVYKSKVWSDVANKCVGCGTCNLLCSTCYCFDVKDELEIEVSKGKRDRFWDGCMLNEFAEVAGGENFREKLSNRTRHRLYRKFKYITDISGELNCVGCGRCSKYCPVNISIVEIINDLIEEYSAHN